MGRWTDEHSVWNMAISNHKAGLIESAFERNRTTSAAARYLGISRMTLIREISNLRRLGVLMKGVPIIPFNPRPDKKPREPGAPSLATKSTPTPSAELAASKEGI